MAFKQRKFRAKITAEDEEEAEDGPPVIKPPSQAKKDAAAKPPAAPAAAKKEVKAAKPSLLSFDEDVDDPGSFASKKEGKKDKQRSLKLGRAPALSDLSLENAAQPSTRGSAGAMPTPRGTPPGPCTPLPATGADTPQQGCSHRHAVGQRHSLCAGGLGGLAGTGSRPTFPCILPTTPYPQHNAQASTRPSA